MKSTPSIYDVALLILAEMPEDLSEAESDGYAQCETCGGEGAVAHVHDGYCDADCDEYEMDACEDCDGEGEVEDDYSGYDLEALIDHNVYQYLRATWGGGPRRPMTPGAASLRMGEVRKVACGILREIIRSNNLPITDYERLTLWRLS